MDARIVGVMSGMAVVTGALTATPAVAAPPTNDNRADAVKIDPPETVKGTLIDATLEPTWDSSNCGGTDASVWYQFIAPKSGAIIVQFDADGRMDATVDLYRQTRSKLSFVDCEDSDGKGAATLDDTDLQPGADYVIRVGRQSGSVADTFSMKVLVPQPAPTPPGKRLPDKGAKGSVSRLLNSGDAYWARLREGVTMRVDLRVSRCTELQIFGPGTEDFDESAVLRRRCGGYTLFTPEQSGRHFFVVWASKGRDQQKYRLRVERALRDDTAPGVFIGNNVKVKGHVNGGIDSRDLYRFDVSRRSQLLLETTGSTDLLLMRDDGRRMGRSEYFDRVVAPGRYFVAVEGSGKYVLHRVSRTITHSRATFNGQRGVTVQPGSSVRLGLRVSPSVSGRGLLTLQRLDPVDGWQFVRRYSVRVSNGSSQVGFTPDLGRYRLFGEFKGSSTAAASETGIARLKVQGPLTESAG